jgi:protease I
MARVLIALPANDFDPTEAAVPWKTLTGLGHRVSFATPEGAPARADERMLSGRGLGPWRLLLRADGNGCAAYADMAASAEFRAPMRHADARVEGFDGLVLPGGHAPGMKPYLESPVLQALVAAAFARGMPVGAICHGVVLAARSRGPDGRSVLYGRRTTALTKTLEFSGWLLTALWLGRYYRTYPTPVQTEVSAALARPQDFVCGPPAIARDAPGRLDAGFTLRDGSYVSARWPGDAHRFASDFAALLPA